MNLTRKILPAIILLLVFALIATSCSAGAPVNNEKKFARGVWMENTYTNDYAGVTFNKPESWVTATDEELKAITDAGAAALKDAGTEINAKAAEFKVLYDVMAQDPDTMSNVMISYENLELSLGGTQVAEKDYLDLTKSQMEAMGLTVGDYAEETIGGNTYQYATIDYGVMQQDIHVRKVGNIMVTIIVSVAEGDDLAAIMACFE